MNIKKMLFFLVMLLIIQNALNAIELIGHRKEVASVAWSPDGSKIASGSWDTNIIIWNAQSGRALKTLSEHKYAVSAVAWSPNGKLLAAGSYDNSISIWDTSSSNLNSWKLKTRINSHQQSINAVAFSPDGTKLASSDLSGTLNIFDTKNFKNIATFKPKNERVLLSLTWSFNSAQIIVVEQKTVGQNRLSNPLTEAINHKDVYVLDATEGKPVQTIGQMSLFDAKRYLIKNKLSTLPYKEPLKSMIIDGILSPDKKYSAIIGESSVDIIDENALNDITEFSVKKPNSVSWSPDSSKIAVASDDTIVHIFNVVESKSDNNNTNDTINDNAPRSLKNSNS